MKTMRGQEIGTEKAAQAFQRLTHTTAQSGWDVIEILVGLAIVAIVVFLPMAAFKARHKNNTLWQPGVVVYTNTTWQVTVRRYIVSGHAYLVFEQGGVVHDAACQ